MAAGSEFNSSLSLFRRQEMFQNMVHIVIPVSLWLSDDSCKQFLICGFTKGFKGNDVVWAEFRLLCFPNNSFYSILFKLRPVGAVSKPPPCW